MRTGWGGGIAVAMMMFGLASTAVAQESIGHVKKVDGAAAIVSNGQRKPATPGLPIYRNDVLETGPDGAIGVTFKDNSICSIGERTTLAIDEFVFAPQDQKFGFLGNLSRGTLLYVSGTMAKLAPDSVTVGTPAGTLGIRGTRFAVRVDE